MEQNKIVMGNAMMSFINKILVKFGIIKEQASTKMKYANPKVIASGHFDPFDTDHCKNSCGKRVW